MSQTSKRPGARDISDLKARLGLKKTGGGAPVGGPPGAGGPPAGIVPPPGAASNSSIPAPPGLQPPPQAANPFAPAAQTQPLAPVAAPAPDIVIVNDGQPVESVGKGGKAGSLGKTVALVLAPLIAGVVIGKVAQTANQYNQVIADAKPIKEDVTAVRRSLGDLQVVLEGGKKGGKFAVGDEKLLKALGDVPELTGDAALVYKSALYTLEPAQVSAIYGFYTDLSVLQRDLKAHISQSKTDAKALQAGLEKLGNFSVPRTAALVSMPSSDEAANGKPPQAQLVELGPPICQEGGQPSTEGCGGALPFAHPYRVDQTGGWKTAKVAPSAGEAAPGDSLLYLDPTVPMVKQVVQGSEASIAEASYLQRIEAIEVKTTALLKTGQDIVNFLNAKANESGKFSFFL